MRYAVPAPVSLGACLARLFQEASGRTRKQMLGNGRVRVNGTITRSAGTALAAGDVVEIGASEPRTVLPPALIVNPSTPLTPALVPFNSMIGVPAKPGCVVPSMITGLVIVGKALVGAIVCKPLPMLN